MTNVNEINKKVFSKGNKLIFIYLDKNLFQYQIDFTSIEYISKSDASLFTFGTHPNIFNVQKNDIGNNVFTFSPIDNQKDNCMWDLNRCTSGDNRKKQDILIFNKSFFFSCYRINFNIYSFY